MNLPTSKMILLLTVQWRTTTVQKQKSVLAEADKAWKRAYPIIATCRCIKISMNLFVLKKKVMENREMQITRTFNTPIDIMWKVWANGKQYKKAPPAIVFLLWAVPEKLIKTYLN